MNPFAQNGATDGTPARLRLVIALICGICLLAMMALTVADVLGRYLMNAPVAGATELTELLLAAIVFMGLPAASLDHDHIAVDALTSRFAGVRARVLEGVVGLVSAAVLAVVAWRIWIVGAQIAGYGGTTPTLKLPLAPVAGGAAVLCLIAAALTLATLFPFRRSENV